VRAKSNYTTPQRPRKIVMIHASSAYILCDFATGGGAQGSDSLVCDA
jgi:hypothetical protein